MSRDQWLILLSAAIPIVLIALGMVLGWRALRRRQTHLVGFDAVPSEPGEVLFAEDLLYVSTTPADKPLERIAVRGLAFRARAVLTVTTGGIVIELAGAEPGFLPTSCLVGVGRASWTIDRVVSNDGLVFVRWTQGPSDALITLDSNFRSADPAALVDAIGKLIPTAEGAPA